MIRATDRELLIAVATAARQRLADHERDSWPTAERDEGPEHIAPILDRVLEMYGLRPLDEPALMIVEE